VTPPSGLTPYLRKSWKNWTPQQQARVIRACRIRDLIRAEIRARKQEAEARRELDQLLKGQRP